MNLDYNLKQKLDSIAECIYDKIINKKLLLTNGLYSGEFGNLLFIFEYSKLINNRKYRALSEKYTAFVIKKYFKDLKTYTFCDGLSGVLYFIDFLREKNFIDIDITELEDTFDDYLISNMRSAIQQSDFDFMHGSLGVGLYYLKSNRRKDIILELIDFLYKTAEKEENNNIFKWKSSIYAKNKREYNISLSHGISSIVMFCNQVIENKVEIDKTLEIRNGAINYILSQEIDVAKYGSFFPHFNKESSSKSRLGWCYGDLGIAMTLWRASNIDNNKKWRDKSLEIFHHSTKRLSLENNFIFDAGICHGSAGIALIFRRMYLDTKEQLFLDTSQYWLNKTLELAIHQDSPAGYKSLHDKWIEDYSLLNGISGIGLVFISHLQQDRQEWDKIFLLS